MHDFQVLIMINVRCWSWDFMLVGRPTIWSYLQKQSMSI